MVTLVAGTTQWIETGLSPNTSYYRYVEAYRNVGISSASAISVVHTLPPPPVLPSFFNATITSTSSITWEWQDVVSTGAYTVYTSTGGQLIGPLPEDTTYWIETGLNPNTLYGRMLMVSTPESGNAFTSTTIAYTLANEPVNLTISSSTYASVSLTWGANTNPTDTRYAVAQSTDSSSYTLIVTTAYALTSTRYTDTSVIPETTYYYKVIAYNGSGISTAYTTSVSTVTPIGPPTVPTVFIGVAISTHSIYWGWNDVAKETGYRIISSTGGVIAALGVDTTYYIETGLTVNTHYTRYVEAYNVSGSAVSGSVAKYTHTIPAYDVAVSTTGMHSITLAWAGAAGSFYRIDRGTFTLVTSAQAFTDTAYGDTMLVVGTTYAYVITAYNGDLIAASTVAVTGVTQPLPATITLVSPTASVPVVQTKVSETMGEIKVIVPPGAITIESYIDINANAYLVPTEVPKSVLDTAIATLGVNTANKILETSIIELNLFDLTGSTVTGTFSQALTLEMSYPDANNDGFVDGVSPLMRAEALRIFTLNKTTLEWERVTGNYSLDKVAKKVSVEVEHFSMYALVGVQIYEDTLNDVQVHPNPYKPGDATYGDSSYGEGVVFTKLTENATIRIFTISGDLIVTLTENNADGFYLWDTKNDDGDKVASGVYIYYITAPGVSAAKGKLAIIR